RSALQIADRAADLGATLNSGSGADTTGISARSLTRNFSEALELLADVALHPSFPKEELERVRSERLTSIVQEKDEPFSLAMRVLASALYGPKHTYGYPDSGTTESIKAISREDLGKFWKQNYFPDDAALVVTGNIKLAALKPLLEKQFGAWKAGRPAQPPLSTPETTDAKLILVDRPGAPQTRRVCSWWGLAGSPRVMVPVEVLTRDSAELFTYDLPLDYFSTLPERINAVTVEQAQAVAKKYIQPDKMIVLAVGDRAKIEEDMKRLNLGKVEIRDTDGKIAH